MSLVGSTRATLAFSRGGATVAQSSSEAGAATAASGARPRRRPSAAACPRLCTPSLRRTAETWWAAVRSDTTRRRASSAFPTPSQRSARTSSSRAVRPAGFSRVLARVQQWPQRTRRAEGLARPPQDPGRRLRLAEAAQQQRLADAGLSRDKHEPALRACAHAVEESLQERQTGGALQ